MKLKFVSARDNFYNRIFWGVFVFGGGTVLLTFFTPTTKAEKIGAFLLSLTIGMVIHIYTRTFYEVTPDRLTIHFGPFRQTIERDRIFSITPHKSIYTAPTLSCDRLQIRYDKYGEVQVSPKDRGGFLEAMNFPNEDDQRGL